MLRTVVFQALLRACRSPVERLSSDTAHSTFQGDTEIFALLMFGRLPLPVVIAEVRMRMEGDRESITAFAQWFGGV